MSLGWNIVAFVLILMFLVLVHEAGHMVVAKWCGMRVEKFSIFFGRPLAKFRRGETEYGIGWLPLGGYVKITGMTRDEELPPEVVPRAYYAAKTWKKVATIFAGPFVNLVVAFLCFAVVLGIGRPIVQPTNVVEQVTAGSPASALGIAPGDRIVSVDGISTDTEQGFAKAIGTLQASAGTAVVVRYERDGSITTREVVPVAQDVAGAKVGRLGVQFQRIETGERNGRGVIGGVSAAGAETWYLIEANAKGIGSLFTSEEAREQVGSVVAIGAVYNQVADDGLLAIIYFIGIISLVLAIFNLLPIFPLDGGHILFAVLEKLKGSPISTKVYERSAMVGWAVILLVFFFALSNDVVRLTGEGFQLQ
ncbi:MAG: M50 family metallopeptidase [Actinomycetota bacterium]|jgi:regulator of sigma E protease